MARCLLLPLVLAGMAWMMEGVQKRRPAKGVNEKGPAPVGSLSFLDALCRACGWSGCEVDWWEGRIPAGYGTGSCDACVTDHDLPRIACRSIPSWPSLLCHEAEHVRILRNGGSGEPDETRVAALLARVLAPSVPTG